MDIKRTGGFTFVEVLISMVLLAILALASMYILKTASKIEGDTDAAIMSKISLSYKNVKSHFRDLYSADQVLKSSYACVNDRSSLTSYEVYFVTSLCEEEDALDVNKNVVIEIERIATESLCPYAISFKNKTSGRVDTYQC